MRNIPDKKTKTCEESSQNEEKEKDVERKVQFTISEGKIIMNDEPYLVWYCPECEI